MRSYFCHALLLGAAAVIGASGAIAQQEVQNPAAPPEAPFTAAECASVIDQLADALDRFYFDPAVGANYAKLLRGNLAAGNYNVFTDPVAFAAQVTADLQARQPDAHLQLRLAGAAPAKKAPMQAEIPVSARPSGPDGLEAAEMIGTTAYLRFNMFPYDESGPDATAARARRFLLDHAHEIRSVIIDERPHRGGGDETMNAILPLFFAERTTLLREDSRPGIIDGPLPAALVRQPSDASVVRYDHIVAPDVTERRLRGVTLYVLTSRRTASAAEHLALALKRTGRATLIGERTRGAGHFGSARQIGRFTAFIPFGETYDPDTHQGWEGSGVAPDIAVPADDALAIALRRIG